MGMVRITGAGPNIPAGGTIALDLKQEEIGVSVAISLSQEADSMAVWRFQVFAITDEGERELGQFVTRPPGAGDPGARVVAFVSCPGARSWRVQAFGPAPTVVGAAVVTASAELNIASTHLSISGAGVADIVPVNGTRKLGIVHPAPQFLAGQGILSAGPGQLFTLQGFTDPAQPVSYIGPVDKAAAVVNGDVFADAPIQLPPGGANFVLSWPDGLPFANQIRWAISSTINPITLGPVATIGARRT